MKSIKLEGTIQPSVRKINREMKKGITIVAPKHETIKSSYASIS